MPVRGSLRIARQRKMEGITIQTAMNFAAVGVAAGSLIFSWLGIHLERDWFLMMGLLACCLGNLAFTAYLREQGVEGERRDALVAFFLCCFGLTLYATYCQCVEWYEEGELEEEDEGEELEDDKEEAAAAAEGEGGGGQQAEEDQQQEEGGEEGEEGEEEGGGAELEEGQEEGAPAEEAGEEGAAQNAGGLGASEGIRQRR
jgi:hypothetical protein